MSTSYKKFGRYIVVFTLLIVIGAVFVFADYIDYEDTYYEQNTIGYMPYYDDYYEHEPMDIYAHNDFGGDMVTPYELYEEMGAADYYSNYYSYDEGYNNAYEDGYIGYAPEYNEGGFISDAPFYGIMPLTNPAPDRIVTTFTTPGATYVAGQPYGLVQAVADAPLNQDPSVDPPFIIAIANSFGISGGGTWISGGRNIIIATYGTELDSNSPNFNYHPTNDRHTLTRIGSGGAGGGGRHFRVDTNSTLSLHNIIICGDAVDVVDGIPLPRVPLLSPAGAQGGIFITGGGTLYMHHNTIVQHNRHGHFRDDADIGDSASATAGNGGGIAMDGSTPANPSRFYMLGGELRYNVAAGSGGGLDARSNNLVLIDGGIIRNNRSGGCEGPANGTEWGGGGVLLSANSHLNFVSGEIRDNTSVATGGGVRIRNNSSLTMHPGTRITGNSTSGRGGGGIFLEQIGNEIPVRLIMYGGEITHNVAHFHIRPAIPANVPVQLDGGGIQMAGGIFELRGPEPKLIAYNTSVRNGGGINWIRGEVDTSDNIGPLHIRNNRAAENGGGMFIRGSGFVVDENIIISDNTAGQNGGGIHLSDGNLTIDGGVIRENGLPSRSVTRDWRPLLGSCNPTDPGHPAIDACGNPNCGLVDIETVSGGGVFISGGTVTMIDGEIDENEAKHSGGGVFSTGGNFNMSGGDIVDNTARGILADDTFAPADSSGGGGVFMTGGNFTMSGTDPKNITHNTALNGGGVHVSNGGSFTMAAGGNIAHNNAPDLGTARGIGVRMSGGDFFIDAGVIRANIRTAATPSYGGGVYVSGGTVTMNGGIIGGPAVADRNEANVSGGGVFVSGGNFLMSGGTLQSNRALGTLITQGGGGAFVAGGNFNMTGTDPKLIINNHALNGGGVYVADGGNMIITTGGSVSNSTTPITGISHGVGVHISGGNLTMNGGVISNNIRAGTPNSYGGGVFITGGGTFDMFDGTVYGNEASNGGGVRVEDNSNLNLFPNPGPGPDPIIRSNTAVTNGGGVSIADGSTFMMSGGTIGGNIPAHANIAALRGGGVWVDGIGSSFTMSNGTIEGNVAQNGGGVNVSDEASALMTNGIIRRNRAIAEGAPGAANQTGTGGGVFLTDANTTFTINGGQIYENIANTLTQGRGGGGIEAVAYAVITLNQTNNAVPTEIFHNYALNSGGGINIHGTTMHMHGGRVRRNGTENAATHGNGGGIAVNGSSTLHMHGGIIENNVGRIGGGLFLYTSRAYIHPGAIIRGNASTHPGGGVAVYSGWGNVDSAAHLRMYGGLIDDNGVQHHPIASVNPQGLPVPNLPGAGTLTNTPRGGGVATGRINGTFEMRGGTISNNQADFGGGIAVLESSNVTINPMGGGQPLIFNNTALYDGGGVHISGFDARDAIAPADRVASFFVMNGGTINDNTATQNGGGIFIANDTITATVGGTPTIRRNQATLNAGSLVTNNTANATGSRLVDGGGGGIYVTVNGGLTAANATITGNEAPNGMGGGIFTEIHEYANPLTRYQGSPLLGAQTIAYSNLTLTNVTFNNNSAYRRYVPPVNATNVLGSGTFAGTSQPTNPAPVRVHSLNNYDINFLAPGVRFDFHKTNQRIFENPRVAVLLPGAQFRLFRAETEALGGVGSGGLVPADLTGTPWVEVTDPAVVLNLLSTNIESEPISFYMTPGFIYQLVEVVAPSGYQVPFGQWQLRLSDTNPATIIFTTIGDPSTPGFIPNNFSPIDIDWFLGNRQSFDLPLTGGDGMSILLAVTGTMLIATAGIMIIFIKKRKEMAVSYSARGNKTIQ